MKSWTLKFIKSLLRLARLKNPDHDREALAEAVWITFSGHHGQIVLAWLVSDIFYTLSHSQNITARDTAFNDGQRAVVKMLLDLIDEHEHPPEPIEVEKEKK